MALNIYLNSRDKSFGSASDFEFQTNINNIVRNTGFQIRLEEFTMPFLEYGVNSKNNSLIFEENGNAADIVCSITPGYYTASEFIALLETALQLNGANTYIITYNTNTKKITISAGVDTFRFVSGNLLDVIGFVPQTSFSSISTGSHPINLAGSLFVDIYTNLITNNFSIGVRPSGTLLARIPCNAEYGELLDYVNDMNHSFTVLNDESINNLAISLYDDKGRLLDLPENCYASLVLSLRYDLE